LSRWRRCRSPNTTIWSRAIPADRTDEPLRIYVLRPYVGFAKQYVRPESERKVYSCSVAACVITRPADPRPPQMFEIDRTCSIRENEIRKTALGDRWRERPFRYPIRDPAGHIVLWGLAGRGYDFGHRMEDLIMLICCGRRRARGGEEPEVRETASDFERAARPGRDRQG